MRYLPPLLLALATTASAQQSFFGGIGVLVGTQKASYANRLSANGLVVVGSSYDALGVVGVKYTRDGGLVSLGRRTGNGNLQGTVAQAVSADGSLIAGTSTGQAIYWKDGGGAVELADVPGGGTQTYAYAVSADGSTIGGRVTPPGGTGAGVWKSPNFAPTFIGDLPGGFSVQGVVSDLSADGKVAVGSSSSTLSASQGAFTEFNEAFRYANGVMTGLGDLPSGRPDSLARAVSADGKVVVGYGTVGPTNFDAYHHAFRWTEETGMVDLGTYLGDEQSDAFAISADGEYIGGTSTLQGHAGGYVAIVRTATTPWITAEDLFLDAGGEH